jgi:glycosyltransferase involved in cell wall biosynthesis
MNALVQRVLTRAGDAARCSRLAREVAGWLHFVRALGVRDPVARATKVVRALEMAESKVLEGAAIRALERKPGIENAAVWREVVLSLPRYRDLIRKDPALSRSIILKLPGAGGEKGVLLMTFEYNWARLLAGLSDEEFRWFDEHFDVVLSTSWSPTDYAVLAWAASRISGTIFVQACNYGEIARLARFHPRVRCLETLPCDWINPVLYQPKPYAERTTDIVMVANWGAFKRHWELFAALARLPPNLRVVLIGQQEPGRTKEFIRDQARLFGARQELEICESIPIAEVAAHQVNAKVSVIMTRREGCCVAAVESLFAGCALAMRSDAHVGPLAYINEHTGARLRPGHVAEDLAALLERAPGMRPHEWAAQNLACQVSQGKLNRVLQDAALKTGRPWTRDVALPQWRPHPTFASTMEQESMRPAYEELHRRFPTVFPADLVTESWR